MVVSDDLGVIAGLVTDVGQAPEGNGLAAEAADAAVELQCALPLGGGLVRLDEAGMEQAEVIEHGGLPFATRFRRRGRVQGGSVMARASRSRRCQLKGCYWEAHNRDHQAHHGHVRSG
jgi:hypothetical protein